MKIDRNVVNVIIKRSSERGAELSEIYMASSRSLSAEVKAQEIEALESSRDFGFSLRVVRGKRLGFSYSTDLNDWKTVVDNAIESSIFTEEDSNTDLAEPGHFPDVNIHDSSVANISEENAVQHVMDIEIAAIRRDKKIKKVRKASGSFSESEIHIANSKGLSSSYRATSVSGQITVTAESGEEAQMGWGYESSRFLDQIDFGKIGVEAAERALRLLGAQKALTTKGHVLLESSVATDFLRVLASSFSSDNIQKGKSLLAGKMNMQVISGNTDIYDDGIIHGRVGSRPFDSEGTPSQQTRLIEAGMLSNYLYNISAARKDSTISSGNAVRGGIQEIPTIGISNLYLVSSSDRLHSFHELIRGMDSGLIVTETMGLHTSNPITGEFSVGVTGLWVENGEVKHPVKEAAISGNILELFSRIVGVSNNLRFYGKIGSPDILIESVDISG
jgi:PmbA protein